MPPGDMGGADTTAAAVLSAHSRRLRSAAEQLRRKEAAARLRLEDATSGVGSSPLLHVDQYATEAKCRTPAKRANYIVGQCYQINFDDIRLALKRLRAYNRLGQAATTLSGKEISPVGRQIEGTTISDASIPKIKRLNSERIAPPHWAAPVDRAKLDKQLQKSQTTAAKAVEKRMLAQAELERAKQAQIAKKYQDAVSSKASVTQWWSERLVLENSAEISVVRLNAPRNSQGSSARLGLGIVFGNILGRATITRVQPGSWASNQPALIPGLVLVQLQGCTLGKQSYARAKELLESFSDTETIAMVFRDITAPTLLSPPPNVELCLEIRGIKSSQRHRSVQGWRHSSEGLTTVVERVWHAGCTTTQQPIAEGLALVTVNGMYVAEQPPNVLLDTIRNSQQVLVTLGWPRQCSAYGGVTGYHSSGNGSSQDNSELYADKQELQVIEASSSYSLGTGLQAASWCVIASN